MILLGSSRAATGGKGMGRGQNQQLASGAVWGENTQQHSEGATSREHTKLDN